MFLASCGCRFVEVHVKELFARPAISLEPEERCREIVNFTLKEVARLLLLGNERRKRKERTSSPLTSSWLVLLGKIGWAGAL